MSDYITYSDVLEYMENVSKENNSIRRKNLHLSELAICGFKYRYKLDNNLFLPFNLNFQIGNAFESIMVNAMKKLGNVISQYVVKIKVEDKEFIGHLDAFDIDKNVIYELKTSMSYGNFQDIYERQLKAYMLAVGSYSIGILWIFKPIDKRFKEVVFEKLEPNDNILFNKNIEAFVNNRYVNGIENSLCSFCENVNCEMRGKKVI